MTPQDPGHGLPATTHTLEMAQLVEVNLRLANRLSPVITAAELGMTGVDAPAGTASTLAADAILARVTWEGSPEFPTVHGHFGDAATSVAADLHTTALREISRRLHLRQRWGV